MVIIGGDLRQKFLFKELSVKYDVTHCIDNENIKKFISQADVVIMPVPTTKDKQVVFNTFSDSKIYLNEIQKYMSDKLVITYGYYFEGSNCIDLNEQDAFAISNAVPTAEGAIALAVNNTPFTIWKSKCLVVGNGRTGRILAERLNSMKAYVTVSARKLSDFAYIEALGMDFTHTGNLVNTANEYDIIFNTVNAPVITADVINALKKNCLIIELASKPGGIDITAAENAGIKIITAPGVPGKTAPETAAKILANIIKNLI